MWEFYLAGSEAAFRWQDLMVFQIQLTRRNDTLPITRGYIEKCEKALALHGSAHEPELKAEQGEGCDREASKPQEGLDGASYMSAADGSTRQVLSVPASRHRPFRAAASGQARDASGAFA